MKNRIALRLILYFSSALVLFSVVIGTVFILLFRNQVMRQYEDDLKTRAASIADTLSDYMSTAESNEMGSGRGMGMGGGLAGYSVYLRFIDDIAMTDVWLVDEDLQLITGGQASGTDYNYSDLPQDAETVVGDVFGGETVVSESFSGFLNTPTITVGTPILVDGEIIGAVLLHSPVEITKSTTDQGVSLLLISIVAALVLSVVLSAFLALSFTKPLNRMKKTALLLAGGHYDVKTDVRQHDEIGELASAIDVLSDRLDEARREHDRLEQLRRDFTANVSHELRTPVTVIRGSLEALCDEVVTDQDQIRHYHRQMLSESIHLQRLVSDLLDLSRLQNADFKMETQELNLCDVLKDAVQGAASLAKDKPVDIRLDLDRSLFTYTGDFGRLRQMFLTILDNAVKFSPENGVVNVSLQDRTVTVSDQGPGIAPEDLPYLFDRFYKVRSEDNQSGSGLGLAIAKQIADRHGITITVMNRESAGSVFRFDF